MGTVPETPENSSSERVLQYKLEYKEFLDGKREGFCGNLCQLKGKTVTDARQCLVEHTEKILKEIEKSRGSIRSFTIEKSCVQGTPINNEEFSKWNYDNINYRWTFYGAKDKGYNCLIVLCGFTDDSLPCKDVFPDNETEQPTNTDDAGRIWKKKDIWGLAFEQYLTQYFALQKEDPRVANRTLDSGGQTPKDAWCSVVYIAVKLEDVRCNNFDELVKHWRKGYTANLYTDLNEKTPENVAACLYDHSNKTLKTLKKGRGTIEKCTIGRSHATYRILGEEKLHLSTREFSTWNVSDSIDPLWESFENKNYDLLVVLCGIKKSDTAEEQHVFTRKVLQMLKEKFKADKKIEISDGEEETDNGAICAAIYMAVMFKPRGKNAETSTQSTETSSTEQSDSTQGTANAKGPQKETIKDTDNTTPLPAPKGTSKEA